MSSNYVLITGASSGIGEATARRFAKEGRNIILIARRADRLKKLAAELKQSDIEVRTHALDITDSAQLEKLFASLKDIAIDVAVNNAGLALGTESFDQYDFKDIQTMVDTNITAFMHLAYLSLPFLRKSKGHLVNLGSIAGKETYAGGTVYCATKHFVHAFSSGLRKDLLGSDVRITTIAPGRVETEFSVVRLKGDNEKAKKVYEGYTPLQPSDIADAIWYAVSRPKHVNVDEMLILPTDQAGLVVRLR